VSSTLKENIQLHLTQFDAPSSGDSSTIQRSLTRLVNEALQPFGYYQAETEVNWNDKVIRLRIKPGPVVVWGNSDIQVPVAADTLEPATRKALQSPPFPPGEPIQQQDYDNYKKQLLLRMRQQGYLDANWDTSQLRINLEQHSAQVVLVMNPGPRYRISAVRVSGSELSDRTIDALLKSPQGEYYNATTIGTLYDDLLSTGYYRNALIDVERTAPGFATLVVELEAQARDQFTTGLGYGTDTGVRGKLGWTRARVNSRGDDINSNLQVSQIGEELSFQYRIPWHHPLERYLSLDAGWKRETTLDRESTLLTTGISLKRSRAKQWQSSAGINLESETYRQGNNPTESVSYLLPNYHYIHLLKFNEPDEPASILKYWFDSSFGTSVAGDATLFLSAAIGASWAYDFNTVHGIATRFELGGIMTDDFYSVPLSKRFYTGGDQTVRGFRYNSLAPEDNNGELIGGQFLNVASVEYRYSLNEEWRLATFVDTGRTFISSHDPFHSGAGIGLRWMLPIGLISFDVAKPVTGEDKNNPRLHIYLGMLL